MATYDNTAADMGSATYNGDGLRTAMATTPAGGSKTTEGFVWDVTSPIPHLLMDGTNAYLYAGGNAPLEQVNLSTGAVSYLVADALGSVRAVVASSGSVKASTSYGAWGTPTTAGGVTADTPFGFAGGYTDPSGLIYLINRYYDPQTGQFLSVDPLVKLTQAPYSYARNDPVDNTDPTGDCVRTPFGCIGPGPANGVSGTLGSIWNDTGGKAVHAVKTAAVDTGQFVYNTSSTLSTIASHLATVAYASCAITEGIGCGFGLTFSATSTALSGLNTYRACFGGAGGCEPSATSFGLGVVTTGVGFGLQSLGAGALRSVFNSYASDIYLARQAGVIGAGLNGLSAIYSWLSGYIFGSSGNSSGCVQ